MKYSVLATKSVFVSNTTPCPPLWRRNLLLIWCAVGLACLSLPQTARAVTPPPDGGYPNFNTAEGDLSLLSLTSGTANTAVGYQALASLTTGSDNVAVGQFALSDNVTADGNTAIGTAALVNFMTETTGTRNTGCGAFTLGVTTGSSNTGVGYLALSNNTEGNNNVGIGDQALGFNITGDDNTGVGFNVLLNNTGSSNIAIGDSAGINLTTGKNNIDIGNAGNAGESNKIRIGTTGTQKATFVAGISGVTVPSGIGVIVGTDGKLGTVVSSAEFKDNIQPMDKASEAILSLQPVTFRYKKELDPDGIPQFGLVAEQVEHIDPDLVAHDERGKPYSVRYEAVNAMLLNEFLKEHRRLEEQAQLNQQQQVTIVDQQKQISALAKSLKEQAAQLQRVSDQIALSGSSPRTVATCHVLRQNPPKELSIGD